GVTRREGVLQEGEAHLLDPCPGPVHRPLDFLRHRRSLLGSLAAGVTIPMQSRWSEADAAGLPDLEHLLYASRLTGADQSLVLWCGGNTSAKVEETDFRGRRVAVLRVKGSGSDLRTIR